MKKFEYKVEEIPKIWAFGELTDLLNSLGSQGWELCEREYGVFIFKRELKQ